MIHFVEIRSIQEIYDPFRKNAISQEVYEHSTKKHSIFPIYDHLRVILIYTAIKINRYPN
jgi:hypothetical protein